jgi:hypothetical protein
VIDVYVNLRFFPDPRQIGTAVARWDELGVAGVVLGDHIFPPTAYYRDPVANRGYVNIPVYRGSTIVFPTLDALESPEPRFDYGRTGNPSSAAVEEMISELEGAFPFVPGCCSSANSPPITAGLIAARPECSTTVSETRPADTISRKSPSVRAASTEPSFGGSVILSSSAAASCTLPRLSR